MAERTKYLTQATLFAPAANKWASDTGIINNNGGLLVLKASNNLSDIADTVNARINLGLRIGSDIQPYSERLTAYANGSAPSAFSLTAMGKTTALEWRDFIGAGTVTSVTVSGGSTGLLFTNGTTTGSGTSTLGGVLAITHGGTGVSNLSALRSVIGVSNVDNTADSAKPISDATQTALNNKFDKPLGSVSQYIRGDGTLAAFPTLESSSGTVTSVTLSGGTTGLSFTNGTITNSGTATLTGTLSLSNGGTGVTTVTALRTLLSINNVNNTSDVNKPISTAQQAALDRRVRIPASFSSGATLELPTPEAGKVLGWNAQGTALINTDGGTGGGVEPGAVYVTVDVFDSNGVNRNFVMSRDPESIDNTSVTIGGVSQTPGLDYTLSGSTITLTTPAPEDEKIVIRAFSVFVIGELNANQISTDVFTQSIIPDNANAQIALQALETALSLVQTSLSQKVSSPAGMSDLVLPTPEAGKAIGWNPSATSLVNLDLGSGSGDGTAVSYADIFTGDGTSVNFTLSFIPNTLDDVSVSVGGVDQIPGESYTITGVNILTFSEAVPVDTRIIARYIKAVIIDELTAAAIGTTNFTGSTIPNGSSVQQAIQALENAVELGSPGSGSGIARSHVDIFTADGTATRFPLSVSPVYLDNLFVEVGGIIQVPGVNYTWDSDTNDLVITPAVSSGETIVARYLDALVIDTSQLGVARVQKFTSVLNQTDYVLDYDPIDLDEVEIAVGGIVQSPGDHYTLVLPNIIRFTPAPDPDLNILIRYGSHRTLDGGVGIAVTDRFTGDGVQTQFTLSENPGSLDNLLVIIDTVIQTPTDDYLWTSGSTLTFITAPENAAVIVVRYGVVNTGGIPTANVKYDNFTSNGSTTVYTLSTNPGSINNLHVTFTGLTQSPVSDYTFTAPYTLTLTEAPEAGTAIQVKIGGTLPIGVTQADLISTDVFTGSIIPDGSNVQQALQSLEAATESKQPALGYTPVRQGGGIGQSANTVYVGWTGTGLNVTVDSTDIGPIVFKSELNAIEAKLKITLTPMDFGAIGNGIVDDGDAINAMFSQVRSLLSIDPYTALEITGGGKIYRTTKSLNFTGMGAWNTTVKNLYVIGACTGKAVFDLIGTRGYTFNGVGVWGDKANRPAVAFQAQRGNPGGFCDNASFVECFTDGWFTRAAVHDYGQETTKWDHCTIYNRDHTARVAIHEGYSTHAMTSDYTTVMTGGTSFINKQFLNCDYRYLPADENLAQVTAVTNATNGVVTAIGHAYQINDKVVFHYLGGMPGMMGIVANVTARTANTFTIDINTTAMGTYTSGGIAVRAALQSPIYIARTEGFSMPDSYVVSYGQSHIEFGYPDPSLPRLEQLSFERFLFEGAGCPAAIKHTLPGTAVSILGFTLTTYNSHISNYLMENQDASFLVSIFDMKISSVDPIYEIPLVNDPTRFAGYGSSITFSSLALVNPTLWAGFGGEILSIATGKNTLFISDTLRLNSGRTIIDGSFSTGSGTPTLGTNKPGASGDPTTWLKVSIDGGNYWIPAWSE